jgi:predicted HD phosphohydrolase
MSKRATFTSMATSSQQDWQLIVAEQRKFIAKLPERILSHLKLLDGDYGGFPVDRLQHCLQTATLAHQAGEDEEYVVCALLHDIGDTLGSVNHADVAAVILEPFVSEANHWMVKHHGIFQGYFFFQHIGLDPNLRDQFRDHAYFDQTAHFCEAYDNLAFNPAIETLPLDFFEPMLQRVFSTPRKSLYKMAVSEPS